MTERVFPEAFQPGCAGGLRARAGGPPPFSRYSPAVACIAGMAAGLMLDLQRMPLEVIQSLCFSRESSLLDLLSLHLDLLPFSHAGMLIGWLVSIAALALAEQRLSWTVLASRLIGAVAMIVGMLGAEWMVMAASPVVQVPGGLLIAMTAGMAGADWIYTRVARLVGRLSPVHAACCAHRRGPAALELGPSPKPAINIR